MQFLCLFSLLLIFSCNCRDIYYDDRCWFQNSNIGYRWWKGETTDLGHSRAGTISNNHFNVCQMFCFYYPWLLLQFA